MKAVLVAIVAVISIGVIAGLPVHAQQSTEMTDAHISRIKNACPTVIATLSQIHANDALVYVNRNQTYFSISDKLIARLNSRLALNRYDTTALAKIANEYNNALTRFRANYKQYDDVMGSLVRTSCAKQPVGFYDKVAEARELREKVHGSIGKLHAVIEQYRTEVDAISLQRSTPSKGSSNE